MNLPTANNEQVIVEGGLPAPRGNHRDRTSIVYLSLRFRGPVNDAKKEKNGFSPYPLTAAVCCILFFFLGYALAPLAGLQTDEVIFASGIYEPTTIPYSAHLFHKTLPLMLMPYMGASEGLVVRTDPGGLPAVRLFDSHSCPADWVHHDLAAFFCSCAEPWAIGPH